MSDIELRQLRYFVAVAEKLSFGKAARALHISQPPLSRQVGSLEESLGARLLTRSSTGVALTPAGLQFLSDTKDILQKLQNAVELAQRADKGEVGTLHVGCSRYLDIALSALLGDKVFASMPSVDLHVEYTPSTEQPGLLRRYRLDAGIVRLPLPEVDQLAVDMLYREPVVAMFSPRHEFASRNQVSLRDLNGSRVILFPPRSRNVRYDPLHRLCAEANLSTEVVQSQEPMVEMVERLQKRTAIALVPASLQYVKLGGVSFLPIDDKHAGIGIALLHRRNDASPLLQRFVTSLQRIPTDLFSRHHSCSARAT